jgi:hypothetical protein
VDLEQAAAQPVHEPQVPLAVRERRRDLLGDVDRERASAISSCSVRLRTTVASSTRSAASTLTTASCWIRGSSAGSPIHARRAAHPRAVSV